MFASDVMNVSIAMEEDAADDVGAPVMDENDIEEEEGGAQVKKTFPAQI